MTKIIPQRNCEYCNKVYQPGHGRARFCSRLCSHKAWIAKHKERWTEYMQQWMSENPNYHSEYCKSEKGKEVQKRRHEKHPLHRKARGAISNAVRLGKIVKPTKCEMCGRTEKLEAHHWKGYEQEHWLDVQWLCHSDHLKADNA